MKMSAFDFSIVSLYLLGIPTKRCKMKRMVLVNEEGREGTGGEGVGHFQSYKIQRTFNVTRGES